MMKMNKTSSPIVGAVLCFCSFAAVSVLLAGAQQHRRRKITDPEVKAVIQAVEDEIYDYGYEENYYQFGEEVQIDPRHLIHRVPIYIRPEIEDGGGEAIYELLPYGEVFRSFDIGKDGVAVLDGNPENGFPQSDEYSRKTLWMEDAAVFQMKQHWLKHSFDIDASADEKTMDAAARRQKLRTGFSYWQSVRSLKKKPSK